MSPLALAVILALVAASEEPSEADRAEAKRLVDEGNELFREKRYALAIQRFESALEVYESPKIHVNLAEAHRELGNHADAVRHYEVFVARGSSNPKVVRKIQQRLSELEPTIGRIELSGALDGANVRIGSWSASWADGWRVAVAPGSHEVVVTREGAPEETRTITVTAGETVRLELEPAAEATPPIDLAARTAPSPPAPPLVASTSTEEEPVTSRWWFWAAIGGAVVLVAGVSVIAATTGGEDDLVSGELPRTGTSEWTRL